MQIYYRISDNSYQKIKLPGSSKITCLNNFLSIFGKENVIVIADKCSSSTLEHLKLLSLKIIETDAGNAGSFRIALDLATSQRPDTAVYFVEDDYLHRKGSLEVIEEGLAIADYVTLYDHPDKYTGMYGFGETSQVKRTKSTHWRYTSSTCMTFATKAKTIDEDQEIWMNHISGVHPNDHYAFVELGNAGRKLGVTIPGFACHTDMTFSYAMGNVLIDEWAIDLMIEQLGRRLDKCNNPEISEIYLKTINSHSENKFELLMRLASIAEIIPKN